MSLLDNVLEKVKRHRNLKDASIKIFKRNILILAEKKEITDFDFLKNKSHIEKILGEYKPETQNSILQSVNRVLEQVDEPKLLETYKEWYYKVHNAIRETPSDVKTEAQAKNWIEWDDVRKKEYDLVSNAIDTTNWEDILNAFILMLYTDFEPRRNQDYLEMMIVSSKKKPEELGRDKNYLLLKPNIKKKTAKYYFVFNKFKTAKTFGQQIFAVPEIIEMFFDRLYYKYYPFVKGRQTPLLISNGMPLKSNSSITLILNKIFGKKIGASMLRHIYLTHKFGANYKDREMVSNKMSHSISTQHRYIKESD